VSSKKETPGEKLIASNPSAFSNFFIEECVEAGLILTGTEIKSLRAASPNLKESFVEVLKDRGSDALGAWLVNAHIAPYKHGNIWNHEPLRRRKLLLHFHQIEKLFGAITQKGMTVVPTRMYFKKGRAKLEIGIAKGKKKHDKRQAMKEKTADREMKRAMKR